MTTVLSLLARAMDDGPTRIAVRGPDAALTYGELGARAQCVAGRLVEAGVGPGDRVGLCVDRSAALVVGALGILQAGAAYVAIDPRYPAERVRWMLEDAAVTAVVADPDATVPAATPVVGVPAATPAGRTAPALTPPLPTDIAYVVYTSGSTGRPKGVPVPHAALANLVAWHRTAFSVGPDDRCTQIASPGFDASVWEIWPTLACGAALHVVPDALRTDPLGLRDWLVAQRITVTFLPTAVAEGVIGLVWPADTALRHLLTGGDALTRRPAPDLPFALINNYGCSETAVVATSGRVAADGDGPPTIGRAIAGVTVEILDDALAPVPPGAEGELVVGGVAVGPGYLGRPALTAERFLAEGEHGRRYRTGDRARRRADGEIEFLGRIDDQLSIRGVRVEPGEVAAALNEHPAIAASVAVGTGRTGADRQLVAYVVAADGARPGDAALAGHLRAVLPEAMIPSRFVWLDALPVTAHGKVDRAALPDLATAPAPSPAPAPATSADAPEATIAAILAELLEVDAVDHDENFFLLGGHSMLGAQLIVRLDDLYGVEISLRHLFDHPTATEIAAEVDRQRTEGLIAR
jgi:amino acid adenylation domain-containing protein